MKLARGAQILVLVGAFLLALVAPAAATSDAYGGYGGYGDDAATRADGAETVIYVGTADDDGRFRHPYEVPNEVKSSFDVFLRGTADDGGDFERQVATVAPSYAGRRVVLTGENLEPGSQFTLYTNSEDFAPAGPTTSGDDAEGNEAGTSPAGSDDVSEQSIGNLDGDSSNNQIIGGVMVVALLIAAAVVYGLRLAGRESY